jgi:Aminotransferase class-III
MTQDTSAGHPPAMWNGFANMAGLATGGVVTITGGEGSMVFDADGRSYLDALASLWYCNIGHGRAALADAAVAQMRQIAAFQVFETFSSRLAEALARRVADLAPMPDTKVFFTPGGGSDAIDTAAKLARASAGRARALGRPTPPRAQWAWPTSRSSSASSWCRVSGRLEQVLAAKLAPLASHELVAEVRTGNRTAGGSRDRGGGQGGRPRPGWSAGGAHPRAGRYHAVAARRGIAGLPAVRDDPGADDADRPGLRRGADASVRPGPTAVPASSGPECGGGGQDASPRPARSWQAGARATVPPGSLSKVRAEDSIDRAHRSAAENVRWAPPSVTDYRRPPCHALSVS